MGAILGLTAGLGLAMIVGVLTGAFPERRRIHLPVKPLAHAVFAAMGAGAAALLAVGNLGLALAAAVAGAWLPAACDKRRIRRRLEQARLAWPRACEPGWESASLLRACKHTGRLPCARLLLASRGSLRLRGVWTWPLTASKARWPTPSPIEWSRRCGLRAVWEATTWPR